MRNYTLSILEDQLSTLHESFRHADGFEWASYLFASKSETLREARFIVKEVQVLEPAEIESNSATHVSIKSTSYVKAMCHAARQKLTLFLVHNHPSGSSQFSYQDKKEEKALVRSLQMRDEGVMLGSLLIGGDELKSLTARVWSSPTQLNPIGRIRIIGKRLHFHDTVSNLSIPTWSNRQVLAFGPDNQLLLKRLHIGVVGAGGTGSAVCEQLIRLGAGEITVIDPQELEETNVARVYGATIDDVGKPKVELVRQQAERIGLGTIVHPIQDTIYRQEVCEQLKNCDLVFGCSDDNRGRMLLNRLAIWYYIPVIDMAVAIDSKDYEIRSVIGRVNLLSPGKTCLRCVGRVSTQLAQAEAQKYLNPEEYQNARHEGYAPELDTPDPSVIMFTSGIASRALCVFMQLLTGFMGDEVDISEIRDLFHDSYVGKSSKMGKEVCFCMDIKQWGKGDRLPFLGLTW